MVHKPSIGEGESQEAKRLDKLNPNSYNGKRTGKVRTEPARFGPLSGKPYGVGSLAKVV